MICLAYLSSATRPLDAAELGEILGKAQRNNARRNVTGLLCHYDGNFLQFLEGGELDVADTFAAIRRDRRHDGILEVYRQPITERGFANWTMGVVRPNRIDAEQQAFCRELGRIELQADAAHLKMIAPFLDAFRAWVR